MSEADFDYVIVGAGSAGCVLADRLTEDGRSTVARAGIWRLRPGAGHPDAGGAVDPDELENLQLGLSRASRSRISAAAGSTAPAARFSAARPRSTASSMCAAIRSISSAGRRRARRAGVYANVLPYFRRAESFRGGADAYRGRDGPRRDVARSESATRSMTPSSRRAGRPAIRVSADLNGEQQEGFGRLDMTVKDGVRWSTANAYLRPAMKRPNLAVVTQALATRIAFEGRRAVGVHYRRGGRDHLVAGAARGDPVRRRDQFAATPEAVGRRPGRGAARARNRRRRRPAGRRREPAGPSRVLFPGRLETADHALRPHRSCRAGAGRAAMARCAGAGSARPTISRPEASSARAPASAIPTSSSISCRWRSPTTGRRWRRSTDFRRMSGRCARRAAAGCG